MLKAISFVKDNWPQISAALLTVGACLGGVGELLKRIGHGPDSRLFHAGELLCSIGIDICKLFDAVKGIFGAKIGPAVVAIAAALLLAPKDARALEFKAGPSCSLMEVRISAPSPVQLAPGLGIQGGLDLGDWTFDLAVFGSLLGVGSSQAGALSVALFACWVGTCVGPMVDVATSGQGGLTSGDFTWRRNFGVVFSVNWDALQRLHFGTAAKAGG